MDRKGVSPMVATMLLIFFAVALGTVIMTWGTSYAAHQGDLEERREEAAIKCERFVNLQPYTEDLQTCSSSIKKRLTTKMKNTGEMKVDGIKLILIGSKNFETTFFDLDDVNLGPGEEKELSQNYDFSRLGHVDQLEIQPRILLRDSKTEYHACKDKIIIEEVGQC